MLYLVMWKYDEGIWKTYTTTSLKSAILVYEFKQNIYDTVEFYQKQDNCMELIIRGGKVES
jgi:hypothetical protein